MKPADAACTVLREASKPLHYAGITARMLAQNLWKTTGKRLHGQWERASATRSRNMARAQDSFNSETECTA